MGVRIVCANLFCSIPYNRGALRALRGRLYQAYVENFALSIAPRLHIEHFARGNTVPPCIDTLAVRGCAVLSENDMVEPSSKPIPAGAAASSSSGGHNREIVYSD